MGPSIFNLYPYFQTVSEIDDKMSLIPSKVSKVTDGTLILDGLNTNIQDAIGKKVETESGETGVLICSNGMGIQPLDLFSDIMISQRDLQNFLGEENYKPTDGNIALSIKAYLKFCALTKDGVFNMHVGTILNDSAGSEGVLQNFTSV